MAPADMGPRESLLPIFKQDNIGVAIAIIHSNSAQYLFTVVDVDNILKFILFSLRLLGKMGKVQEKANDPKKKKRYLYDEETMKKALAAVRGGISKKKASEIYSVPRATLIRKLQSNFDDRQIGPEPDLGKDVEIKIRDWMLDNGRRGYPVSRRLVFLSVKRYLDSKQITSRFANNMPGLKWWNLFKNRHPEIKERKGEALTRSRANVRAEHIREWFCKVRDYLTESKYIDILKDPSRIYNADESGFLLCPKSGNLVGPSNSKEDFYVIEPNNQKEQITVMATFCADGWVVPPLVIYPYTRIPKEIGTNMPNTWGIGASKSGWMNGDLFFGWIGNHFVPQLKAKGVTFPIILFIDGHRSHLTYDASVLCEELGVILICLLPNTTHILQPADVGIFKPIKAGWRTTVKQWSYENYPKSVTRQNFANILHSVFECKFAKPETVKNAFRKCGLFPFSEDAVDFSKCMIDRMLVASQPRRSSPFLDELEKKIEPTLLFDFELKLFKSTEHCDAWTGDIKATYLYELWRQEKLKYREQDSDGVTTEQCTPMSPLMPEGVLPPSPLECSENANPAVNLMGTGMAQPINAALSKYTPPDLPSPFKDCFVRPPQEELKARKKLSWPVVAVSSEKFRDYVDSVEKKKQEKEMEKLKKKEEREKKKLSKEEGKKKVTKNKPKEIQNETESESDISMQLVDSSSDDNFLTTDDESSEEELDPDCELTLVVGEFYVVFFDVGLNQKRKYYIGQCSNIFSNELEINCMRKKAGSQGLFVWPATRDEPTVDKDQILKKVVGTPARRGGGMFFPKKALKGIVFE